MVVQTHGWAQTHTNVLSALLKNTKPGDTVYLSAGRYEEHYMVQIPTGVSLEGAGMDKTIIIGMGSQQSVLSAVSPVTVKGDQTISRLTISGNEKSCKKLLAVDGRDNFHVDYVKFTESYESGLTVNYKSPRYSKGFKCTNSVFLNCAHDFPNYSSGALMPERIIDSEIAYNDIREGVGYGIKGHDWSGVSIHHNEIHTPVEDAKWKRDAAIENWYFYDHCKIYSNVTNNWFSIVHGEKRSGDYSVEIYDNRIIMGAKGNYMEAIELMISDVRVHHNYIEDAREGFAIWPKKFDVQNILIDHNIVTFSRGGSSPKGVLIMPTGSDVHGKNIRILHNNFIGLAYGVQFRCHVNGSQNVENIEIANNIFMNLTYGIRYFGMGGGVVRLDKVIISKNDFFNVKKVHIIDSGTTQISNLNWNARDQLYKDPMFIKRGAAWDNYYELNVHSPLIDAGTDAGFPYSGDAPDVGARERK